MPVVHDLVLYQGDHFERTFIFEMATVPPTPHDFTGHTARAQLRTQPGGTLIAEFTCIVEPPNTVRVIMPSALASFAVDGVWDLQLIDLYGRARTYLAGRVTATPEVTR
jgi:hypothetical protein